MDVGVGVNRVHAFCDQVDGGGVIYRIRGKKRRAALGRGIGGF